MWQNRTRKTALDMVSKGSLSEEVPWRETGCSTSRAARRACRSGLQGCVRVMCLAADVQRMGVDGRKPSWGQRQKGKLIRGHRVLMETCLYYHEKDFVFSLKCIKSSLRAVVFPFLNALFNCVFVSLCSIKTAMIAIFMCSLQWCFVHTAVSPLFCSQMFSFPKQKLCNY